MNDALVLGRGVSRTYHAEGASTLALSPADFEIPSGGRVALTGPSGSGKTTLLHLIAGLDAQTSGTIEWPALGDRGSLRPLRLAIAFQGPSLIPALSVAENVAFPLLLGGASEVGAHEAAADMLERMELAELSAKLPEELSGGQSQRVALARALVVEPALLLADEPTGQQDHAHAEQLLDLVLALAAEKNIGVLIATHDEDIAARLPVRWRISGGILETEGA